MPKTRKIDDQKAEQLRLSKNPSIHFSKTEIEKLMKRYEVYVKSATKMDRHKFTEFLQSEFGMTDAMLMDCIFKEFDQDRDNYISKEEWVTGMSIFLRGLPKERQKFCFNTYCTKQDETHLKKEGCLPFLKNSLTTHSLDEDPDEGPRELMDMVVKMMDIDHDGQISYDDFQKTVNEKYPLLEQVFGQVLPTQEQIERFEASVFPELE